MGTRLHTKRMRLCLINRIFSCQNLIIFKTDWCLKKGMILIMKIGIITDIHSNIQALKAILNEFEKIGVDKIICCGDIIGIGISPEEVVQELINLKDKLISVKGNHEQYILRGLPKEVHDDKRKMSQEEIGNHKWNHSRLSQKSIDFLAQLKELENINIEGKDFYIVHYPSNADGTFKRNIKSPNVMELKEMFNDKEADIYLFRHTHTNYVNKIDDKWYINAGSLGCPMNGNCANASLLEIDGENIKFENVKVEYDVREIIDEIIKLKMPFYREVLKIFYGVDLDDYTISMI